MPHETPASKIWQLMLRDGDRSSATCAPNATASASPWSWPSPSAAAAGVSDGVDTLGTSGPVSAWTTNTSATTRSTTSTAMNASHPGLSRRPRDRPTAGFCVVAGPPCGAPAPCADGWAYACCSGVYP